MPEGPSIVILKEKVQSFKNKNVIDASGSSEIDYSRLTGKKIVDIKSHGKHFLICFKGFFIQIHLLMFGTYRIDEAKETEARLHLQFKNHEINFYTCQVKMLEGDAATLYDWRTDIMSEAWKPLFVEKAIRNVAGQKICDVLLNQEVFTGVGNIIKNESLFNARLHPESLAEAIPKKKLKELIKETRLYSLNFYTWRKSGTLSRNWHVYQKKICPRDHVQLITANLGKTKRLSFYCDECQIFYQ